MLLSDVGFYLYFGLEVGLYWLLRLQAARGHNPVECVWLFLAQSGFFNAET